MLAAAILISTVLFLVDRNQKWPQFWRFLKWGSITAVVSVALVFGYLNYQASHQAKLTKAKADLAAKYCTQGDVIDQVACEQAIASSPWPVSKTPAVQASAPHQ